MRLTCSLSPQGPRWRGALIFRLTAFVASSRYVAYVNRASRSAKARKHYDSKRRLGANLEDLPYLLDPLLTTGPVQTERCHGKYEKKVSEDESRLISVFTSLAGCAFRLHPRLFSSLSEYMQFFLVYRYFLTSINFGTGGLRCWTSPSTLMPVSTFVFCSQL